MKDLKHISKFLSLILRHKPEEIGIHMDANGWVSVDELIEKCNTHNHKLTFDLLEEVVFTNDKQRFTFSDDYMSIRANQGHTVQVDLQLDAQQPPEYLFHGTVAKFMDAIRENGLLKMQRQHVHLSKDLETAVKVGSRRGRPIILKINAAAMHLDGYTFYHSKNGVWLCHEVPVKYIQFE
ncbi:MAG: RNA 2'-phosphotransferase [Bacteroidetes bacterium]|nr:RNA 2'-phosphotransferase [Bacteroidota bacterium]